MREHSTGDWLRHRLLELRRRRGLSQTGLSKRLADAGVTLHPTAITKIERGARAVTIEEVLALAYVLNVSPTNLILPTDDDLAPVKITPKIEHQAEWVRDWIAGVGPLPADDSEADYRAREDEYLSAAPVHEQRAVRAALHPLMIEIEGLKVLAREAVLAAQGEEPDDRTISPTAMAEAMRDAAARISTYTELLGKGTMKGGRRAQH